MFETPMFKALLIKAIETAGIEEIERHESIHIADYLQELAVQNEDDLMVREFRKSVEDRRGIPDALASARALTLDASSVAADRGRTLIKLSDIQAAYRINFCKFWPFCK